MAAQTQSRAQTNGFAASIGAPLLALLFAAAGIGAILLLVSQITASLSASPEGEAGGQVLLTFLYTYGIIVPLLLALIGLYLLLMSVRLFQRQITAASWARQLLLWVIVACVVLILQAFTATSLVGEVTMQQRLTNAIPFAVGLAVAAVGYWWLGNNMTAFVGQETLEQASSRSAWNLLVPTIIVLLVVAMRPLEKTFIASLTDDTFAAGADETVTFVGFDNYARLLGFRLDALSCVQDETGACTVDEDGATVFPRAREALDEGYADLRYREVSGITLGSTRLIFSGRDRDFWDSMGNTIYFTVFSVTIELVLGLCIALVINSKFRGRGLLRTAMLVPWAIPTVVSARLWELMLRDNSSGVINSLMLSIGLIDSPQAWLANTSLQIPALIAIDVWKTTPFMALILLAGLQVIPGEVYEAAQVDGATGIRRFFSITLPLLIPAITIALVFRTLDAVRVFDLFQVLLGQAKQSLATYNYNVLINQQALGYASAIGVVIFIIILIFTVLYVRILGVKAE